MKRDALMLAVGIAVGLGLAAGAQNNAVQEVEKAETAIQQATLKQDVAAFSQSVAADAIIIPPDGRLLSKGERAEQITKGEAAGPAANPTPITQQEGYKARVYGDTVIITAKTRMTPDAPKGAMRTRVWVKRNSRWELAHSQQTVIK